MRSPELAFLWQAPGPCVGAWSARSIPAATLDALRRRKVLYRAETPEWVECPSCCHTPETIEVQRRSRVDGGVRLFGVCPECGVVDLERDDCLRYSADYGAVAACLSVGLEIDQPPEPLKPGRIWKLGQARIGGKVRHVWACRGEPGGDCPRGGVAFVLGPVDGNGWPEGVLRIPAGDVLYWDDDLAFDREACDAYAEPGNAGKAASKPRRAESKRAPLLKLADDVAKELERHIRDARDDCHLARRENRAWRLPAPPTRKWLARKFGVSESSLSRALADDAGKRAKALLDNCADERFVLNFRR